MSANLTVNLDLDEEIYTDWGDNFSTIIKAAVEDEIQLAVKKAMNDKKIKERVTAFVMSKMKDRLDELEA